MGAARFIVGLVGALAISPSLALPAFQLTIDSTQSPAMGVSPTPVFSWAAGGDAANFTLSLWRSADGASIWSSPSTSNTALPYSGLPLSPSVCYGWSVTSLPGGVSAPALFCTAIGATPHNSTHQWASATPIWAGQNGDHTDPAFVFFRKLVSLAPPTPGLSLSHAVLHATSNPPISTADEVENSKLLGGVRVYVDGRFVGIGPGRPGTCGPACPVGGGGVCTCAPHSVYDTYLLDAASLSGKTSIVLALQAFALPSKATDAKVVCLLVLGWSNGNTTTVGSDTTWATFDADSYMNTKPGDNVVSQWYIHPAENYLAAAEPVGWRTPQYGVGSPFFANWTSAVAKSEWTVPLVPRPTLSLAVAFGLVPLELTLQPNGNIWIDMGREIQGGLTVEWGNDAPAGAPVVVWMGEEARNYTYNGTVLPVPMWEMRTGARYSSEWTLRGGPQTIEHHEYLEWRYAMLARPPAADPQCGMSTLGDYTTPVRLSCSNPAWSINHVSFASFGTPNGACNPGSVPGGNTFSAGSCAAPDSASVAAAACVGKPSCSIVPSSTTFGGKDPCEGTYKRLAVSVDCVGPPPMVAAAPPPVFPPPARVTAWQVYYPAEVPTPQSVGQFNSSDAALDSVWALCSYTIWATGLDQYTDSNARQRSIVCAESVTTVNMLAQYATSLETALPRYTLQYLLNERPVDLGWAEWQAMTIQSVYWDYYATGDLSIIRMYYNQLKNWTELALVAPATGLWTCPSSGVFACAHPEVDWPTPSRDGYVFTPTNTVVNAWVYRGLVLFAEMAGAIGQTGDAAVYAAAAASLRTAINAKLWSGGKYVDGLTTTHSAWHATLFALGLRVPLPGAQEEAAFATVVAGSIGSGGACVPSNVMPAAVALDALYEANGGADHGVSAYDLLTCTRGNSWLGMIAQGATTTMEAWNPDEKPNLTWSHPWAASPASAIPRWLLGVQAASPGWTTLRVMPQLGRLTRASGIVPTPRGPVMLTVTQVLAPGRTAPASMKLTVTLPWATPASVCLPLPTCGGPTVVADGAQVAGVVVGDFACLQWGAGGDHVFSCGA